MEAIKGLLPLTESGAKMFTILELAMVVIACSAGWCLVGWSIGYKQGVKDGFNRGRAAGMRAATDYVRSL
jgi:hypothetical protein